MKRRTFSLLAALLFTTAAWAQGSEWQIDPAHTTAGFTVRHMGISNVHGRFTKVSGSAIVDDNDTTKSSVNATMDVASINTGNDNRDNEGTANISPSLIVISLLEDIYQAIL